MQESSNQALWQWQEEGTSWKGIGIYHVTMTIPSREALLGTLIIPDNSPSQAWVKRSELGKALLECQRSISTFHPEIQILQYCLMPDHLHSIWYVRRPMKKSIRYVAQGFWRAAKKLGRAYTYLNTRLPDETKNETPPLSPITPEALAGRPPLSSIAPEGLAGRPPLSSIAPADSRENPLRNLLPPEIYSHLSPIFTEIPFIRPLSHRGQLQTMIRYVQLNPQRLATKRLMPGYFHVQDDITIAGRTYSGVGNVSLLLAQRFATVHVRHELVDAAAQGNTQPLRNYMNGCVLAARNGTVMISPFISPKEKEVQAVLLKEGHCFIILADNGFRDYYKPFDSLFDAVAAGRVLILSPWEYDAHKRHISRADCIALNTMAEQIAENLNTSSYATKRP